MILNSNWIRNWIDSSLMDELVTELVCRVVLDVVDFEGDGCMSWQNSGTLLKFPTTEDPLVGFTLFGYSSKYVPIISTPSKTKSDKQPWK